MKKNINALLATTLVAAGTIAVGQADGSVKNAHVHTGIHQAKSMATYDGWICFDTKIFLRPTQSLTGAEVQRREALTELLDHYEQR